MKGVENKAFEEEPVKTSAVKESKPTEPLKVEIPAEKQRIATPETAKKPGINTILKEKKKAAIDQVQSPRVKPSISSSSSDQSSAEEEATGLDHGETADSTFVFKPSETTIASDPQKSSTSSSESSYNAGETTMDVTVVNKGDDKQWTSTLKTPSDSESAIRPTAWGDTPFNTIKKETSVVPEDESEAKLAAGVPASSSSSPSPASPSPPTSPRRISSTFINLEKPVSPRLSPQPPTQEPIEQEPVELGIPPANVSTATESDANLTRTRKDDTGNELSDVGEETGLKLNQLEFGFSLNS